ncbi:MAG TPA: transketolase [Gemmatimonadaceae bacterium]|nr:transketolase [Gemmatimonadaceae bacterium]
MTIAGTGLTPAKFHFDRRLCSPEFSSDMPTNDLDLLCINTIRTLAMDAVQQAESGHPGTPMALAPVGYVLYTRTMRHDPADPAWPNRDRFILSCGHASMLLYSCLYLTGYDLTLDDLKQFRQWESRTPGHPEHGYTPGVETTTGPLGQGIGNAVGMAVAEAHLAATFNKPGQAIVDHHTYFICSDGDLMEGVSHEAASFAGHFKLGKLIGFYDDNHITIDGATELTFTDDTAARFAAYGWQVLHISDVNDLDQIEGAIAEAQADTERPTLIVTRTHIGYGSPRQDSEKAHGEALGKENVLITKKNLGWPSLEPFYVPDEALAHWRKTKEKGARLHSEWNACRDAYARAFPDDAKELERRLAGKRPPNWAAKMPTFTKENGNVASRAAFGAVLNATAESLPELVGGSADLTPSNNTSVKTWKNFAPGEYASRYVHFGIREHGMAAIMNGMALHGGVLPYGGTFLIFSDYMRPSVRLAAIMNARVIYIYTHDSVGLGEDGPTHQPIEQLSALRAIPNLVLIRPADATETAVAWRVAVEHDAGPIALVLTRQKLGLIDRTVYAPADGLERGGYVLADPPGDAAPRVLLMSSGSEVALVIKAHQQLAERGIASRVVSMPSMELFARQSVEYQRSVLLDGVPRVSIEAAQPMSWYRWVGSNGVVIGLTRFGASAPYERIYEELGLTVQHVVDTAVSLIGAAGPVYASGR